MVRFSSSNGTKATASVFSYVLKNKQLLSYILLSILSYYLGYISNNPNSTSSNSSSVHQLEEQLIQLKLNYKKEQQEVQKLNEQLKLEKHHAMADAANDTNSDFEHTKKRLTQFTKENYELKKEVNTLKTNMQSMIDAKVKEQTDNMDTTSSSSVAKITTSSSTSSSSINPRFKKSSSFKGMSYIPKQNFMSTYDFGSPIDSPLTKDVLLLYTTSSSIPNTITAKEKESIQSFKYGNEAPTFKDAEDATKNCDIMHVATIPKDEVGKNTCFAIVENYNNQLTQKWMRANGNPKNKLTYVNRGQTEKSRVHRPPDTNHITKHWETLRTYLNNINDVLTDLKPIAESVAKDNTIIVLTCNMGQSELLMNFVCNAKAKGLDVGNILVFPTDEETKELAEGLGLTTFHDERNFGKLPKGEAKSYGDKNFSAMMIAKVLCVQLINHLGYDLLFQDVDVVWYKNPLDYFHDTTNPYHDFDMYFQDDGAHSSRYAPYSANSGFYYVRNNDKTRYLFTSLLYHGDMIVQSTSHQQALIQLLTNHASLFGLKVKVLSRDMEEFPGGWHYHRQKQLLRDIMSEKVVPEIFHMSWTKNKDNKVKFFQQMGQWYVHDSCIGKTKGTILKSDGVGGQNGDVITTQDALFEPCCLAEPNIVCHYRDKPSKIPCRNKDPIDAGRPSFW